MTENKFSKYLLYAIGEIILVVIGILIALQINNWNEQRKNDGVKQAYLKSLIAELKTNTKTHQRLIQGFDNRIATFDKLFNTINSENTSPDSLKLAFRNAETFVGITNINKTAFEELINSDNFQVFEKELRDKILTYYYEVDDWGRIFDVSLAEIRNLRLEMYKSLDLAFTLGLKKTENTHIKNWEINPNSAQFLNATNFFTIRKVMLQKSKKLTEELIENHIKMINELEKHLKH